MPQKYALQIYRMTQLKSALATISKPHEEAIVFIQSLFDLALLEQANADSFIAIIRDELQKLYKTESAMLWEKTDYQLIFKLLISLTHFWPLNATGFREGQGHQHPSRALPFCAGKPGLIVPRSKRIFLSSGYLLHRDTMQALWDAHLYQHAVMPEKITQREINYISYTLNPDQPYFFVDYDLRHERNHTASNQIRKKIHQQNTLICASIAVLSMIAMFTIGFLSNPLYLIPYTVATLIALPPLSILGVIKSDEKINQCISESIKHQDERDLLQTENEMKQIQTFVAQLEKNRGYSSQAETAQALRAAPPSNKVKPKSSSIEKIGSLFGEINSSTLADHCAAATSTENNIETPLLKGTAYKSYS